MENVFNLIANYAPAIGGAILLLTQRKDSQRIKRYRNFGLASCGGLILICIALAALPVVSNNVTTDTIDFVVTIGFGLTILAAVLIVGPMLLRFIERPNDSQHEDNTIVTREAKSWRVLMIGDGHVGKTQLVNTILGDYGPIDPSKRTGDDTENKFVVTEGPRFKKKELMFYDHRGQDFGSITQMFKSENLSQSDINCIVFVVDLFGYPSKGNDSDSGWRKRLRDDISKKRAKFDKERIQTHLRALSTHTLDLLFSDKFRPYAEPTLGLKSIILFVNKADKWRDWDLDTQSPECIEPFQGIIDDLNLRAMAMETKYDVKVELNHCVGSALKGIGLLGEKSLMAGILLTEKEDTNG